MKRILATLAVVVAIASVRADLIFTEIMYDPSLPESGWEYVEIYNTGGSVDLQNYILDDLNPGGGNAIRITTNSFTFGTGGIVVLSSNSLASFNAEWNTSLSSANYIQIPGTFPALNNTGDDINFFDGSSSLVTRIVFTEAAPWPSGGAVNSSLSFNLDPSTATLSDMSNGANWSVSASGVNGSFQGDSLDFGSPGTVVPEPASFALLAFGSIAAMWRRRHIAT